MIFDTRVYGTRIGTDFFSSEHMSKDEGKGEIIEKRQKGDEKTAM